MREYKQVTKTEDEVIAKTCDCCGKRSNPNDDWVGMNDFHSFTVGGGFASTFPQDMCWVDFDVCAACLLQWLRTFKLPPPMQGGNQQVALDQLKDM